MDILRKGNKDLIKDINRYTVLNLIREKGEITRTEIAKKCDFGMSTLTYILDDLQQEGIILEGAETSSTGGRRAKLVRFNKDYGFVVSVKVEEEQLLFALTDLNAEIMENTSIPFSSEKKPEEAIELIAKNVKKMCENRDMNHLLGVGIAISGLVNRRKGTVIRSTMLGWENVALEAMLHAYFPDIPVYVDKNINCYTLAELWLGEGKQSNNFATVSVGAGLGLSVVINRQIYYGAQGGAGEFGHTTIQPGGYKCHCGQKGCLEMYASEFYFRNRGEELKEAYPTSELKDFHFDKVAKSARAGDEMATELMGKMGEYLGYGIRNIINTFNPEKVIIVGEGLQFADGRRGDEMRNLYPNDYVEAYYQFAQQNDGMTFSRAGYTGAQNFPAHWAGDERSTFDAFRRSLIAGLSAGFSGIPFWSFDFAGFNGDIPTAELFIRSAEMATFCPIMQYHAESKAEFNQDRTPWNIASRTGDDSVIPIYRHFANVRMNILPYIYNESLKCVETGLPMMRALLLDYKEDPRVSDMYDQYLFGEAMLIAPVIEDGVRSREVYLPEGTWYDFWNGTKVNGPTLRKCKADKEEIPVFIRGGKAVLCNVDATLKLGSWVGNTVEEYDTPLLKIYVDGDFTEEMTDHLSEKWLVKVTENADEVVVSVQTNTPAYEVEVIGTTKKVQIKKGR